MKAEDVQVGKTYQTKVGTKKVATRVRSVVPRTEPREGEKSGRTLYTYQVEEVGSGKVHTLRSPSLFLSEIARKPVKDDLVRLVKARGTALETDKVYRVKSVGPKNAVILSGGKEHRVPITDLRVEGEQSRPPSRKGGRSPSSEPSTDSSLKRSIPPSSPASIPSTGEKRKSGSGSGTTSASSNPSVRTSTTADADIASSVGSSTSTETADRMTADEMNGKDYDWCAAALEAGYDSDNPPPVGWDPKAVGIDPAKPGADYTVVCEFEVDEERTGNQVERRIGDMVSSTVLTNWPNRELRDVVFEALDDCEPAQEELVRRARLAGWDIEPIHAAASWYEVAGMVERPPPKLEARSAFPARKPEEWTSADMASIELGPEREVSCQSMDHLPNPSVPKRPKPAPPAPTFSQRLGTRECLDDSPHVIVEARAGTGKTTTLVEGLKPLLGLTSSLTPSPQQRAVWDAIAMSKGKAKSICFVAFNKSIASELQARVPSGVAAMTMHSMGFNAVKLAFGRGIKVESGRVQNIVSELLGVEIRDLRKQKFEMVKAVEDLVGLCKMNLTGFGAEDGVLRTDGDVDEYWKLELDALVSHYDIEVPGVYEKEVYALVPMVLERCKDVKKDNEIDFNDMIWLPVALGLNVTKYDLLLVDEAQDLNRCQQALAKMAGHRLILVGDARQAIYGFAGADAESLPRMYKELLGDKGCPEDGGLPHLWKMYGEQPVVCSKCGISISGTRDRGCIKLPLTVTRRCGKAIVEEAKKLVPDFEWFEGNGEGKVSRADWPDSKKRKALTEKERELNPDYTALVGDGDFVLCRCNAPLVSQCFRFLKQGKRASIQGRDIGKGLTKLLDSFKAVDVPDLVKNLSDWYKREADKENAKRLPNESKLINLEDKYECLLAFTEGVKTVGEVKLKIESVFADDEPGKPRAGIRLSSVHRAKGLEAKRVFFLMPESAPCPHYMAKSDWEIQSEWNLKYVAITRAIEELVYVT